MPQMRWSQIFLAVALGVLAALLAWMLLVRLFPVILIAVAGFAIAYLLDPLLVHLQRRGWSRGLAVAAIAFLLLGLLALAGILLVPALVSQITSLASNLPRYTEALIELAGPSAELFADLEQRFPDFISSEYLEQQFETARDWLTSKIPSVLGFLSTTLLRSFRAAGVAFLTVLVALWFMLAMQPFRQRFEALFSPDEAVELRALDREISLMLGQYLRGMTIVCFLIALATLLLLTITHHLFGTQYSLLIAVFSGLAYLVPYLGMLTTVVLAALLSYLTAAHDPWLAMGLNVAILLTVNQLFDSYLTPRIIGRKVGLHPLAIVLAMLSGGTLFGLWGMVLATPVAAAIKIMLTRWVPVISPAAPEEEGAPCRPAPLALDLGTFAAQTWKALRDAGREIKAAGQRLGDRNNHTPEAAQPVPTTHTEDSTDDHPGTTH